MGPTRQSVSPIKKKRIPTAPPGPRNDGRAHRVRPRAATWGRPYRKHGGYSAGPAAGASPRPTGLRHPMPAAPRGSTRGGASKRVSTDSSPILPHSGNGREKGEVSETTPRRYISTKPPNQALP